MNRSKALAWAVKVGLHICTICEFRKKYSNGEWICKYPHNDIKYYYRATEHGYYTYYKCNKIKIKK